MPKPFSVLPNLWIFTGEETRRHILRGLAELKRIVVSDYEGRIEMVLYLNDDLVSLQGDDEEGVTLWHYTTKPDRLRNSITAMRNSHSYFERTRELNYWGHLARNSEELAFRRLSGYLRFIETQRYMP